MKPNIMWYLKYYNTSTDILIAIFRNKIESHWKRLAPNRHIFAFFSPNSYTNFHIRRRFLHSFTITFKTSFSCNNNKKKITINNYIA